MEGPTLREPTFRLGKFRSRPHGRVAPRFTHLDRGPEENDNLTSVKQTTVSLQDRLTTYSCLHAYKTIMDHLLIRRVFVLPDPKFRSSENNIRGVR